MAVKPSRRTILAGAVALAAPSIWSGPSRAAGKVYIGSPGGDYDDIMRRAVDEPFTRETGIEVIREGQTNGKILAMVRSKHIETDIADLSSTGMIALERMGVLEPIAYDKWRWGKKEELSPHLVHPFRSPIYHLAHVQVYSTAAFKTDHPHHWSDVWDVGRFPGSRMFPDMSSSQAHLEFALRADGVARDKLYPIDIDRALRSFSRIKPHVVKFHASGAESAQLMINGEAVVGSMASGRAQVTINKGAPMAIEWNEHLLFSENYGIFKGGPNVANAQLFVDFASQAPVQAAYAKELSYGPANMKAFDLLPKELAARMPGAPETLALAIKVDEAWWADNRERVAAAWNQWMLS